MLTINAERLLARLQALAQIGRTQEGGVSRRAFSDADLEGRAWFQREVEEAGLLFRKDGAGNLSAILPAADPQARTLLTGSHLDSVPNGGRYDGALGVLCALEALQTIREKGIPMPYHLEAISFTDEEGACIGTFGSLAFSGALGEADLARARLDPAELSAALQRLGLSRESLFDARRDPATLAGYVEVHIEQGSRLEEEQVDIGVVTAIVGIRSYRVRFFGEAAHAGTKPMHKRRDALWGVVQFVARAREMVMQRFTPGVMNCGWVELAPGSFNIVPGRATLALEFRHSSQSLLDEMQQALLDLCAQAAEDNGLQWEAEPLAGTPPAAMHADMMAAVEGAAERLGLSHMRLPSLAGHDARSLSQITPTAMFFVPSVDGISHNPREYTRDEDVINAGNVLLHTLLEVAQVPRVWWE